MTIPAVISVPQSAMPSVLVGGIPLLIRHIKTLYALGVRTFYCSGLTRLPVARHARLPAEAVVHMLPASDSTLPQHVQSIAAAHGGEVLFVRGDCLLDPRLYRELLRRPLPQWVAPPSDQETPLPAAARLPLAACRLWAEARLDSWLQSSAELHPGSLETYSPSHRGPVPVYLERVTTPEEAAHATQTLIRSAQKHALDLPALLVHPFFENRLVAWLCDTPVTPNQVSLFTGLLGAGVAYLFLHGWLRLGIVLAQVVAVLDGVDGKLARTRLQTSRLGELEHILDFFVEHGWYLTITLFVVTSTQDMQLWWIGGALMALDLVDNLLYSLGHLWFQKQLDELGPFDRRFRLLAGRRNIYIWVCLVGFWAGAPVQSLTVSCAWAGLTVLIHGARLLYHRCGALATT
ncbi:MAG: CDP-alcohol phosphatidyltransferase family protein [Candidatus Tectimicrobiota bacterium]